MRASVLHSRSAVLLATVMAVTLPTLVAGLIDSNDQFALESLFSSTGGPNGDWLYSTGWRVGDSTADACREKWSGVTCSKEGRVTTLQLRSFGLSGTLPSDIGRLSGLRTLRLDENDLTGVIPQAIGSCTSLEVFTASHNLLNGPIPEQIGSLINLVRLDLSHNELSGDLPLALSSASSLQLLRLQYNQLSGPLRADLTSLTSLAELNVEHNMMVGSIPNLSGITSLLSMRVNNNMFCGQIASWLNARTWSSLNLAANLWDCPIAYPGLQVNGTAPTCVQTCVDQAQAFCTSNRVEAPGCGTVCIGTPVGDCVWETNYNDQEALEGLLTDSNTASPPSNWVLGTDICGRYGTGSAWAGVVCSGGRVTELTPLLLFGGGGTLSTELAKLTDLEVFGLRTIGFSDPLPEVFGSMTKLETFDVNAMSATGPIPSSLTSTVLTFIQTSGSMGGAIPETINMAPTGSTMRLDPAVMCGYAPAWIGDITWNLLEWGDSMLNCDTSTCYSTWGGTPCHNIGTGGSPSDNCPGADTYCDDYCQDHCKDQGLVCNPSTNTCEAFNSVLTADISALNRLYTQTGGSSWTTNTNWGVGSPCANVWYGVTCDDGPNARVVGLDLSNNNLIGSALIAGAFTSSSELSELRVLDVSGNPDLFDLGDLTRMVALEELYFRNNAPATFSLSSAQATSNFAALTALRILDLTGSTGLTSSGFPSVLSDAPNLEVVRLNAAGIGGTMVTGAEITAASDLITFDIAGCTFTGAVPDELFSHSTIVEVDLSDNVGLTGALPPFHLNPALQVVRLGGTALAGALPPLDAMASLRALSLRDLPGVTGVLPAELTSLTLEELDFSGTMLSGALPFAYGHTMPNLRILRMRDMPNVVLGIPTSYGLLTRLEELDLSNSQLSGVIPEAIGNAPMLQSLILEDNMLTGSVPRLIARSPELRVLDLSGNMLSGMLPTVLTGDWPNLESLDLSENQFYGDIPASWVSLTSLTEKLDLHSNSLCGFDQALTIGSGAMNNLMSWLDGITTLDATDNNFACQDGNSYPAGIPSSGFDSCDTAKCSSPTGACNSACECGQGFFLPSMSSTCQACCGIVFADITQDRFVLAGQASETWWHEQTFTVEAWIRPDPAQDAPYAGIVSAMVDQGAGATGWSLHMHNDTHVGFVVALNGEGPQYGASTIGVAADTWTHVRAEWTGQLLLLSVNGAIRQSGVYEPSVTVDSWDAQVNYTHPAPAELRIGVSEVDSNSRSFFSGSISQVRLWSGSSPVTTLARPPRYTPFLADNLPFSYATMLAHYPLIDPTLDHAVASTIFDDGPGERHGVFYRMQGATPVVATPACVACSTLQPPVVYPAAHDGETGIDCATRFTRTGVLESAVSFDALAEGNEWHQLTKWTIDAWVRVDAAALEDSGIVSSLVTTSDESGFGLVVDENKDVACVIAAPDLSDYGVPNNGFVLAVRAPVPVDEWRQVTCTWDGKRASIYLNGQFVEQRELATVRDIDFAADNSLWIGSLRDAALTDHVQFTGDIAQVRLWPVVRTETDILFDHGIVPHLEALATSSVPVIDLLMNAVADLSGTPSVIDRASFYNGAEDSRNGVTVGHPARVDVVECVRQPSSWPTLSLNECVRTSNNCNKHGTCTASQQKSRTCLCDPEWTGTHCGVDVDECISLPCNGLENAQCVNLPGSYECLCASGFIGDPNTGCVRNDTEVEPILPKQYNPPFNPVYIFGVSFGLIFIGVAVAVTINWASHHKKRYHTTQRGKKVKKRTAEITHHVDASTGQAKPSWRSSLTKLNIHLPRFGSKNKLNPDGTPVEPAASADPPAATSAAAGLDAAVADAPARPSGPPPARPSVPSRPPPRPAATGLAPAGASARASATAASSSKRKSHRSSTRSNNSSDGRQQRRSRDGRRSADGRGDPKGKGKAKSRR